MSKAAITLQPTSAVSKLDPTDWSRELWNAAHAMARRMIRDRAGHGIGAAYVWYLGHARKRFGASGWRIAQAAGHAVFDRRTRRPRPGNLTATAPYRCATFERLREHGFSLAWTFDPLASGSNRGLRV